MTIRQGKQIIANTQGTRNYDLLENKPKIDGIELSGEITLDDLNVQSKLSAGTGIEIVDGVISNTQTKPEWGKITGNIAEQTDLQQELAKAGTPDDQTIIKTAENTLQAISLINQNDPNANIKLWLGSEEDYEAVETKDENTVYFTKDGVIDISGESSGGLEIGDIGIAPFGIDETQNKRRYLNGQVISQSQFVSFTDRIKAVIQLNPNLAATEENWQAEVTNSVLGQCGKFVIDDEAGTIRLPKVININGLQDLALMGSTKTESLPNITGSFTPRETAGYASGGERTGAFYIDEQFVSNYVSGASGSGYKMKFDASRSSSTYQDNAPVQQEAIQYPYFIQVAKGSEDSVDITREIELNNPFFLGMSQYFESEPNNASWLISNGSFHSGAIYVSFYEWLLKIYNGTEIVKGVSVKVSTDTYDDYDYVINTADTTFRLPLLNGSEDKISNTDIGKTWGTDFTLPCNAIVWCTGYSESGSDDAKVLVTRPDGKTFTLWQHDTGYNVYTSPVLPKGTLVHSEGGNSYTYISYTVCKGNGSLYFYVGETIQDANVIAASNVLTNAIMKNSSADRETVVGWGIPDYDSKVSINITSGTALDWTAPYDCFVHISAQSTGNCVASIIDKKSGDWISRNDNTNTQSKICSATAIIDKGRVINIQGVGTINYCYYAPLKGVN